MTPGLAVSAPAFAAIAATGALGLLFFLLAGSRGRWALWVAGYVLIIAALALAFVFRNEEGARPGTGDPGHRIVSAERTTP